MVPRVTIIDRFHCTAMAVLAVAVTLPMLRNFTIHFDLQKFWSGLYREVVSGYRYRWPLREILLYQY